MMSRTKEYLMSLQCECKHEYDLCDLCERDLELEQQYWFNIQTRRNDNG